MTDVWLASYIVLWILVLFEGLMIFVLMRELGTRILGTAEGVMRDGLELGTAAPRVSVVDGRGQSHVVAPNGHWMLVVFASRYCAPCRALIPDLNRFAAEKVVRLVMGESFHRP